MRNSSSKFKPTFYLGLNIEPIVSEIKKHMSFVPPQQSGIHDIEFEPIGNIKASIGPCSQEFAILCGRRWVDYFDGIEKNKWTLKLSDIEVNTHDEAYKLMIKVVNSLFFQIDLSTDIPLTLVTESENLYPRKIKALMKTSSAKRI